MSYFHSMDREYFPTGATASGMVETVPTESGGLGISDVRFGISAPPFDNQLQALKARIRQGATQVELGFTGAGKGSMQGRSTTPEMYGEPERFAIKEIAKLNNVELSTHATVGMTGLSGIGQGQKSFSYEQAETTLTELKRAIEFAADTAGGGPIVVHTGEWSRPVSQSFEEDNERREYITVNGEKKPMFLGYPEEHEKGMILVARDDTGDIQGIPRHLKVHEQIPIIEKDDHGNNVLDAKGKPIVKGYERDEETGKIILRELTYKEAVAEVRKEHPEFADEKEHKGEVLWIRKYFEAQREQYEAESLRFSEGASRLRTEKDKLDERKTFYQNLWNNAGNDEERRRIFSRFAVENGQSVQAFERYETPIAFLDEQIQNRERDIQWQEKVGLSYAKQAKTQEEGQQNLKSIEEVGIKRSAETLARAALYAYEEGQAKHLKKPLFIAPEAYVPEQWGSHPEEIIKLVEAGREKMAEYLKGRGVSGGKAEKIAEDHIRATLDIGHMNMWRKFFQPKPGETHEDTTERFHGWLLGHVENLAKKNIIGHLHVTDNFGYHDEHVTPGEGNAPVGEFINIVKKEFKKQGKEIQMIVEPAHQDVEALRGAWRMAGTPVYGLGKWGEMEFSYFGRNQPPYFAIPDMLGVQREWNTSYFGVPFE